VIELNEVRFTYPEASQPALQDVTIKFREGVTALVGPNGAGKTTLLKLAAALYKPSSGWVLIDGVNPWEVPADARAMVRRGCVYLHERPVMLRRSVRENVAYGLELRGVKGERLKERVERALQLMGIEELADVQAQNLSMGQKQRVALARALAVEPRHLLLDEPTANLDAQGRRLLGRVLRALVSKGVTVVISTHDRLTALRLSDRVAVMEGGAVVAEGLPEKVIEL